MTPRDGPWPRYLRVLPWLLVGGGLLWNAIDTTNYWGDPMVAAAAVLAGALLPLRDTLAVAAANVAGIVLLSFRDGTAGTEGGYLELTNTVFAALLGVWINRVVARQGRRLATVRSVAEAAQLAVLPAPPERAGELAMAACYRAAETEALIGGDAYAVQETPYGVRLMIADVRGKGLPAVATMSVLLGAFRENASRAPDLVALADALELSLAREGAHRDDEVRTEGFSTALLVEFPAGADAVHVLSCGHPGPYLLGDRAGPGGVRRLDAADPGLPLGMGALGPVRSAPDRWPLPAGHTLLLVTDGVTEARDGAGRFYDPVEGLAPLGPFAGPGEVLDALARDVTAWTGGPRDDDMAVLAVTRP
ncbi:PP2C family protein-serine/threonine phosphatase [Streptomyces sp. SP17BM10]|uniref:PP2C family protein-serine/threonine phosphatase n=1 Tax=Streptomyces sp. SP17BM10 TaxID=3002530 RepID=UPI002E77EE87|nr:PP2C family protein-serine/threonine phosphatase [Streptomyces sp. SP17BM10]MEE1786164.1 PP2C family protein-serine/threonine phosphatase [Streptomyces sp. SP17BM10]